MENDLSAEKEHLFKRKAGIMRVKKKHLIFAGVVIPGRYYLAVREMRKCLARYCVGVSPVFSRKMAVK